jgi:uncharacterized membrane protein
MHPPHAMHGLIACLLLQLFITTTGVFMSSWLGGTLLSIGEFIIKRLPLVKHIYSASKQVRRCQMPIYLPKRGSARSAAQRTSLHSTYYCNNTCAF